MIDPNILVLLGTNCFCHGCISKMTGFYFDQMTWMDNFDSNTQAALERRHGAMCVHVNENSFRIIFSRIIENELWPIP